MRRVLPNQARQAKKNADRRAPEPECQEIEIGFKMTLYGRAKPEDHGLIDSCPPGDVCGEGSAFDCGPTEH